MARVLAEVAGVSLAEGLHRALEGAVATAAAERGEAPALLAARVLAREPDAVAVLLEHAVVRETAFWRHAEQLRAVVAALADAPHPLTVWSAGCASGEEPYSIAVMLLEAGRRGDRIVATDVSERALAAARAGRYGPRALRKAPPGIEARWFDLVRGERVVRPAPRALVSFERHNLVCDPPPAGPFDAILCRNVLIYFDRDAAEAVVSRLAGALRPGGLLVLGPVELPLAVGSELEWLDAGAATLLRRRAPAR